MVPEAIVAGIAKHNARFHAWPVAWVRGSVPLHAAFKGIIKRRLRTPEVAGALEASAQERILVRLRDQRRVLVVELCDHFVVALRTDTAPQFGTPPIRN